MLADGTVTYYLEPANFYTTISKSLKINIVTDKEHFFIALQPSPFPAKKDGVKIKDDLGIHLRLKIFINEDITVLSTAIAIQ